MHTEFKQYNFKEDGEHVNFFFLFPDVEPSFSSSVSLSKDTKNLSQATKEHSVSTPPHSTSADNTSWNTAQLSSGANAFSFEEPMVVLGLKGEVNSVGCGSSGEFHNSLLGLGMINVSEDSLQCSPSPQRFPSPAAVDALECLLKATRRFDDRELAHNEDEVVQRLLKQSKSKKKKDRKKKRRDSDGLTQSLSVSSVSRVEEKSSCMNKAEAELKKLGLTEGTSGADTIRHD